MRPEEISDLLVKYEKLQNIEKTFEERMKVKEEILKFVTSQDTNQAQLYHKHNEIARLQENIRNQANKLGSLMTELNKCKRDHANEVTKMSQQIQKLEVERDHVKKRLRLRKQVIDEVEEENKQLRKKLKTCVNRKDW